MLLLNRDFAQRRATNNLLTFLLNAQFSLRLFFLLILLQVSSSIYRQQPLLFVTANEEVFSIAQQQQQQQIKTTTTNNNSKITTTPEDLQRHQKRIILRRSVVEEEEEPLLEDSSTLSEHGMEEKEEGTRAPKRDMPPFPFEQIPQLADFKSSNGEAKNLENVPKRSSDNAATGNKRRPQLFTASTDRLSVVRAQLRLRLTHYSNPGRRMQNLTTCACPQQDDTNCGRDGGNHSPCYFSFTAVASSSADQTVLFRFTPFVIVDATGIIDSSRETEWAAEMQFDLSTKPRFVDIYAYNLGPVFSLIDGRIVSWSETVWPVDAWTLDLTEIFPYSWLEPVPMSDHRELLGRFDPNSALKLEFSVKCIGDSMGPDCDMSCRRSSKEEENMRKNLNRLTNEETERRKPPMSSGPGWTICESALEQRRFFECLYRDANRVQVDGCRFCEYGVINETICVHDPAQWKQEPELYAHYKTWAIVLGVLLGVAMLFLLLACIFCWILLLRRFSSTKARRHESALAGAYRHGGAPYSISGAGNGFGGVRLGDPLMLNHPLLLLHEQKGKLKNGIPPPSSDTTDWAKHAQPPAAIRQQHQQQQQQQQFPIMGTGRASTRSPSASQQWMAAAVGSVGGGGKLGPMGGAPSSSPNTSESDYRPSPFTPRREALV